MNDVKDVIDRAMGMMPDVLLDDEQFVRKARRMSPLHEAYALLCVSAWGDVRHSQSKLRALVDRVVALSGVPGGWKPGMHSGIDGVWDELDALCVPVATKLVEQELRKSGVLPLGVSVQAAAPVASVSVVF